MKEEDCERAEKALLKIYAEKCTIRPSQWSTMHQKIKLSSKTITPAQGNINSRNVHEGSYVVRTSCRTNLVEPILIGSWLLCIDHAGVLVRPMYSWPNQPSQ